MAISHADKHKTYTSLPAAVCQSNDLPRGSTRALRQVSPSVSLPEIPWTVYDERIQKADARLCYVVPARCNDPSHAVQVFDGPIHDSLSAIFISNLLTVCLQCDIL